MNRIISEDRLLHLLKIELMYDLIEGALGGIPDSCLEGLHEVGFYSGSYDEQIESDLNTYKLIN